MIDKKIYALFGFNLFFLLSSCGIYDGYHNKVKNNIDEFSSTVEYISSNRLFEIQDSIIKQKGYIYKSNNTSLYRKNIKDSMLLNFMNKFNIDRISLQKRNDNFFNNVIIFHKDYTPFVGKSKTIDFDFGSSPLRSRIESGVKKDGGDSVKILNSNFIYSVDKNPAFGE